MHFIPSCALYVPFVPEMYHICTICTTSLCICSLPSYCQGFAMWHQCHCHEGTARAFPQLLNFDHPSLSCTSTNTCELCHLNCPNVQVLLESNNPGVVVCPCCLLLGRVIRIYTVLFGGYGDTSTQWANCRNNHQMLFAFKVILNQTWCIKNAVRWYWCQKIMLHRRCSRVTRRWVCM